jgi:hypothetical protein
MNNIRQIITERLENARNDYLYYQKNSDGFDIYGLSETSGQIDAYQDCLNLISAPRTETDILKDFEALRWIVSRNDEDDFTLRLKGNPTCTIRIDKLTKEYSMSCCLDMQEHKLLNELFICWGWL